MKFNEKETLILNSIQKGLPAVEDPFIYLSEISGIGVESVLDLLKRLKSENVIRNISGIFDGESLGYFLSLVAFKVPDEKIDLAGEIINSHPGISHNYLRKHDYNIWFTLAEENENFFYRTVDVLREKIGIESSLVLRNEKLLKIGVLFDLGGEKADDTVIGRVESSCEISGEISEKEKEAIVLLQKDLPVERDPFSVLLEKNNSSLSVEELMSYYRKFLDTGLMRRYAAVLMHRNAGYRANAMTAWKPGENFDPEVFITCRAISHLYLRTIHPGEWEYPLFAMIHAKTDDELHEIIKDLSWESGITDYISLESLKEFKKKKVHYFSPEFDEWKRLNYD